MDNLKKITLSIFMVFISVVYVIYQPQKNTPANANVPNVLVDRKNIDTSGITNSTTKINTKRTDVSSTSPEKKLVKNTQNTQNTKKKTYTQTPVTKEPTKKKIPYSPTTTPATVPVVLPTGKYKDGVYTGNSVNAYYGYVQVKATVKNGKIIAVDFLKHPDNRQTSQYINGQAMPILEQETIKAQSAKVSGVSGATYTSKAFRKSLANTLTKAINK